MQQIGFPAHGDWTPGVSPSRATLAIAGLLVLAGVSLLALVGCASTEEQRFPLNYVAGLRAARDPETARVAYPAYQQMGADLERQGRAGEAAIAYSNAFTSARASGRLQEALEMAQKAVEMAERARDPRHLAVATIRLGQAYMDLNAPAKAVPFFEKATAYAKEAQNLNAEAGSYIWLSRAYRRLGKIDLARENTQKTVEVLEPVILRTGGRGRRTDAPRRGVRWVMQLHYTGALLDLGSNYLALGQLNEAQIAFQKALDAAQRIDLPAEAAQAHHGLGRVAAEQADLEGAASHFQEALQLWQQPNFVGMTERRLGSVYFQMGKLPEAEAVLRRAVADIEDLRSQLQSEENREAFVEDKMGAYALLVQVLFNQRKIAEAFDISERGRARAFLDLLGNRVSLSKGGNAALVAEEKTLQERIAHLKAREALEDREEDSEETPPPDQAVLQRELDLARESYAAFLSRIRAQNQEQASLMTVEPLTLAGVQRLLGPDTVLVEYFVGVSRTLAWVVSRDRMRAVPLRIGERDLTRRISGYRELIASRGRVEELQQTALALYQTLLAPAFPSGLPRELVIVPHRMLHYLPFHSLMSAPGRYLLQDSLVYYLSSASLLQFTREKEPAATKPSALAVGNPDLGDPTLNLRYAEREAEEVGRQFPGATVLVRREATKPRARLSMGQESLIHLATHADLDEADPLRSALLFRPEGGDSGRLEIPEVFGLELHASLVILSACETSLGKLTQGDEVIGLTRAFIYAGTPTVISTLWQVDDRASYELMRAFYWQLRAGGPKGEALRQAQLTTLATYPHPYYWAAYELTGEAR